MKLEPGDYMEIEFCGDKLTLTPKMFIEKRIAEGLKDKKEGRITGPFRNAKEALKALDL